ncbi:TetR/AcrR family transcriptional regulator [Herbaspirillum sp. CF444]|uniref:TetR/AcrR family transcriptional regulator n=1 Tax=Herbaspirillum sp. CF444 TaxID=1144319 RepID=UPI001ED969B6|nr:TetR/AcrR family transcriptional regulator [Herbaspirillum sp. CF444]
MIQAALTIIVRDGPKRLTLDAIAREGGMSKGGLMHQFPTKAAVLKALLEHQVSYFENFSKAYQAEHGASLVEPELAAQIAVAREAVSQQQSVVFAILGVIGEDPGLLSMFRELDAKRLEAIRAEAADPELATLRWMATRGMILTAIFGFCPLSPDERERLFERLLDSRQWQAFSKP